MHSNVSQVTHAFLRMLPLCFIYWGEKGDVLVHIYVWEHRVSLNYRITWWIFTKLGRDKVLMTPAHLYWLLGQIRPGMNPGQGNNRSMRGPSPKDFFRVRRLQQQTECIAMKYRITWWIFTKLGRDKVLMTPHICIDFLAKSAKGRIQGRAIIG